MPYANQVVLTGHIADDPELRYGGDNGTAYTKFTIAVQREYGKDKTDFINCTVFNKGNYKLAEYVAEGTEKGKLVTIYGRLQINKWTDKEGNNRRTEQVVCDKVVYEKNGEKVEKAIEKSDEEDFEVPF